MSAIFQVYGLTAADGALSWHALNPLTADALPAEGAGRMHIMHEGEWKGHPSGPLEITREYLQSLVAMFDAQANPMPVDYDHSAPKTGDTRAAGWIHALAIEDDENGVPHLWATDVRWTPKATQAIRDKEYLFNSPWWDEKPKDRVTGKRTGPRMFNVALTNLPFFDGQQPLRCSTVIAAEPATAPVVAAEPTAPAAFSVGDRVRVKPGAEHSEMASGAGTVRIVEGTAIGVEFDAMPGEIHKWYVESELVAESAAEANEGNPMDEFLAAVAKSAGSTPEAVMSALMAKADEIGAMLRDAPPPKEAADPPPPPKDEDDAAKMASEKLRIASEARINGLIASVEKLTAAEEKRAAAEKAAADAAALKLATENTERVASMLRDGRLGKDEEADATKLLAMDATMFASVYKDRKPTVQVGAPPQAGPEVKPVTAGDDHTAGFTASEMVAFRSLTQGARFTPDAARKGILAQRPVSN